MCRGFQPNERDQLKIKAFYTKLSIAKNNSSTTLPDFLTLNFLPRINGKLLEVNGSNIRSDSPALITLHRILLNEKTLYGCRERVRVCQGMKFEIYAGDLKILKGVFRKDEGGQNWNMECKCSEEVVEGFKDAEVSVEAANHEVMSQKVGLSMNKLTGKRQMRRCCVLEEIPEVREDDGELEEESDDKCCCFECSGSLGDGDMEIEVEIEGVRWAVDVGIWVMCIGLGYLVSRAASSSSSRRKLF